MRILVVHPDLYVLAGDVRAMLMYADTFKMMGYDVLFLYTDIRPHKDRYFTLEQIYDYHTIDYLDNKPCTSLGIKLCGNFQEIRHVNLRPQIYDYMIKLREFDVLFTDQVPIAFMGNDDAPVKTILYVHYPDRPRGPKNVQIWANSTYTKSVIFDNWMLNSTVMYPPLNLKFYNPSLGFNDRDIDVVFFGQMYYTKRHFLAEKLADKGYNVVVMGARIPEGLTIKPRENLHVYSNLTVKEYTDILSRSKVYVHARPGEHFGITITEAMASGCSVIVHKSGGQWIDISKYGKYTLVFDSEQRLVENIQKLLSEQKLWYRYHELSISRVRNFDMKTISVRIQKVFEKLGWI